MTCICVEHVSEFYSLDSLVASNGRVDTEIDKRIVNVSRPSEHYNKQISKMPPLN